MIYYRLSPGSFAGVYFLASNRTHAGCKRVYPVAAQREHGGDALQKHVPLLDRQHTRCAP